MQGIKVTKPGKDASSTEPRDFTLHSQYNILKIAQEGAGEFDISAGGSGYDEIEVEHNLGYEPQTLVYFYHPENGAWYMSPGRVNRDFTKGADWNISIAVAHESVNKVNILVETWYEPMEDGPDLEGVLYKYYILIEPRKDAWYE